MKRSLHKSLALILSFAMLFSMMGTVQATEVPSHIHNEECGFTENTEGIPCGMECPDINGGGLIDHAEDCAYIPANNGIPCNHQHDEACEFSGTVNCQTYNTGRIIEKSISVSTEAELRYSINNASNVPENPTIITVVEDIELNEGITVSGNHSFVLQGETENITIKFHDTVDDAKIEQYSMFNLANGSNIDMTVRDIILDGSDKSRLFLLGSSLNSSTNKLILETGSVLKNGNPFSSQESGNFQSGGAIRMNQGSYLIMNDGVISNNKSRRYGGGIYGWATDLTIEINGGTISENTGSYAGGIAILGNGSLFLRGGNIIGNVGTGIHGGGIFVNQDSSLYLSGDITVMNNKNKNEISDIYLNRSNVASPFAKVFLEQPLTGSLYFYNVSKDIFIEPYNNYIITEDDISHFEVSSPNSIFFLDTTTGTVKQTTAKTITFNANAASISESVVQKVPISVPSRLESNPFRRLGYAFTGWKTEAEGGDTYADGASVTLDNDMTLYAQWREIDIVFEDKIGDNAYIYDGTNKTITAYENDVFTYSYAKRKKGGTNYAPATQTAPAEVGYYKVTATLNDYNPASVIAYLEIKPSPLSVSGIKETSKYFDKNNKFRNIELVLEGIQGSDKITGNATATVSGIEVGTYERATLSNIILRGSKKDNYLFSVPIDSVNVENGKYLSIVNPTTPSKPGNEGSLSQSNKNEKVITVRTSKLMKDLLGNENVIISIKLKEANEPVNITVNVGKKLSNKNVYIVQLNPDSQHLELITIANVNKEGEVQFETSSSEELTIASSLPIGIISTVGTASAIPMTYFMMENNEFKKGWLKTDSSDYLFFDYKSGEQQKNKWVADGTDTQAYANWYSLSNDGKMYKSTWIASNSTGSKWYYVNENGLLLRNTVVDGYVINEDGCWYSE